MPKKSIAQADETIVCWKGFDKNLSCRGYQYEVGQTYEHAGPVVACSSGFHACENPMDVWGYYGLGEDNRFARVTLSGELSREGSDSKIAAGKITIDAELRLPDIITAAIKWEIDATKDKGDDPSGDSARIGSSGYSARIGSSGDSARIGSSGYSARIGSSGDSARIGSSGYSARIGSSGHYARIGSSGDSARIGSSGHSARIGSSGDSARIGSSGDYAQIGSSGHSARIGSSGHYAQIGSSGHSARIGSSGDYARIGSSGDYARIGSSGDYARIEASGKDAVVACAGVGAIVKAGENGAICIPYHDGERTRFAVGYVGEGGIRPGVFYRAEAGKLVEVA